VIQDDTSDGDTPQNFANPLRVKVSDLIAHPSKKCAFYITRGEALNRDPRCIAATIEAAACRVSFGCIDHKKSPDCLHYACRLSPAATRDRYASRHYE
jgi:hypothetical protein